MSGVGSPALPVVVLRSNDICFLGILRSCAAAGVATLPVVFTWQEAPPWWSEHSRHCAEPVQIPNPFSEPEAAAAALCALGEQWLATYGERLLVLPSGDVNLMFLQQFWTQFAPYFRLMGDATFDAPRTDILAKDQCMQRLADAGVNVPASFSCRTPDDIAGIVAQVPYPCVYKPAEKDLGQSFYRAHGGDKAVELADAASLEAALRHELGAGFELIVQEKIDFDVLEDEIPIYVYADGNGVIRMAATAVKETIQPFPFGTATVLQLSWHPELLKLAQAVVDALNYRGILMIEFIRDRADGQWKVIELNPRPWLFFDFFRRGGGLNYIEALVHDMNGTIDTLPALQTPQIADEATTPRHIELATAYTPHADRPVGDWLAEIPGSLSLTSLDPDDPEPGLHELSALAERLGRGPESFVADVRMALAA